MKKILLHSAAVDVLGRFCDAGTEMTVSDAVEAGHIGADRAAELVEARSAIDAATADDDGDGLDALTIVKLRELASDEAVDLGELTLKADIVAAIRASRLSPPGDLAGLIDSPRLNGEDGA